MLRLRSPIFVLSVLLSSLATAQEYVGSEACASCHMDTYKTWQGSHHQRAMAPPDAQSVRGIFDGREVPLDGVTYRFEQQEGRYLITDVAQDKTWVVRYTFGDTPLQQYLLEGERGALQAFGLAWDSRPQSEGGQRWFDLYPKRHLKPGDYEHWQSRGQTWNHMCADCHSTNLQTDFNAETGEYRTTYSEVSVGCEACHGPGSLHAKDPTRALPVKPGGGLQWAFREGEAIARVVQAALAPAGEMAGNPHAQQLEQCGQCHARRQRIHPDPVAGSQLDSFTPALLREDLYFPDGQILEEVFVYGSFLQSKMYQAGVVCTDCHNPHSGEVKVEGDGLCAQCHDLGTYAQAEHHLHKPVAGVQCVDCHMPERTYMVVDPRRDHRFHIPRPALAASGVPQPCTTCHTDRDASWAAEVLERKPGARKETVQQHLLSSDPEALLALVQDDAMPAITRATAMSRLRGYPPARPSLSSLLEAEDPLLRMGAVRAMSGNLQPQDAADIGALLDDPARAVRMEAARALAPHHKGMGRTIKQKFSAALADYVAAQALNNHFPESHYNLGLMHAEMGQRQKAIESFRLALKLEQDFTPARQALAQALQRSGDGAAAESLLREGLRAEPRNAALHHQLGLVLVGQKKYPQAVQSLRKARDISGNLQYAYVYAIALHSTGKIDAAIRELKTLADQQQYTPETLYALVSMLMESGRHQEAEFYADIYESLAR
ncbi:tetratricopeptide repeat protein [Biformimicrobium ophioploci]|uniref:Tetratricopeptide repeat protein n=1 Tax=Biformimicrobium ophioploci TaxID=3036711 RepID=A0ABQ6LUS4_9GAMM|nr:tetratricopeptide repeat protein [Microbulbifer sp. NKW57]GMG85816.1 tetratricopeptide repeat protein [Microbulbifer sp. NKW57]